MGYKPDGTKVRTEQIFETKVDIGKPGGTGGFDVGEGGSYQTDGDGVIILKAFKYDASAGSGSRFTEITDLNAQNTLLGDVGDRVYVGSPYKHWGTRMEVGVVKVGGTQIIKFSESGALVACPSAGGMVILKDDAESIGDTWLQQTAQKEYLVIDRDIDSTWTVEDNITDVIPNTGTPLYWVAYEVPSGGWSPAPRVDEIKIRGSDFDVISGASFPVFWGKGRVEIHERLDLGEGSGPQSATLDITSTLQFESKKMRSANPDPITRLVKLAQGIDTSCGIFFTLDYQASAAISTCDIKLEIKKVKNGDTVGSV